MKSEWYKKRKNDKIWWIKSGIKDDFRFSFDRKKEYNLLRDYPYKLSNEELKIFDAENKFWANYLSYRK